MAEASRGGIAQSVADRAIDPAMEIAALRMTGADRLDPVRFHFIEAMATRSRGQRVEVKRILDGKLREALAAYRRRFERTQDDARETIARIREHDRDAADDLQRLLVAGDFSGVSQYSARLAKSDPQVSLADLARHLAQDSPEDLDGGPAGNVGSRAELKAMRYFRNTWSRLSVDRQVTQAIEQGPENAGPLNSHRLVLRSLALMRNISPDYLNRFVSYLDTLLWLDQADRRHRPRPGKRLTTKRR
ncbi:DUF2894 domain-containing protein [Candidatus Accumulibacter phosphatis]|uniref:DUF2894 domain-containing protein n=1 Tax=Candidatus Accumulibacter phosphatis TaxID=327160 RepID=UPI0039B97B7A